jgi:2-polyprenyl-3-methyl-5-hydroxy-6-metoxy-1,4-benzoquinol methylase
VPQDAAVPFTLDLSQRRLQPEVMDQPDLDPGRHVQALSGLRRINGWSGSARILWSPLRELARNQAPRPLTVLDLATGGGDVPIRLWRKARRAGLALSIDGCDVSPRAVAFACAQAQEARAEVHFFQLDVIRNTLPGDYDVVMSSLFLHHLDEEQAVDLLRRMAEAAGRMVLVNDLIRSRAGFTLAYVGTRLLSASSVVHIDGPRSVQAAFTREEARTLAERAGLDGATVERRWPCRFLLAWSRP